MFKRLGLVMMLILLIALASCSESGYIPDSRRDNIEFTGTPTIRCYRFVNTELMCLFIQQYENDFEIISIADNRYFNYLYVKMK